MFHYLHGLSMKYISVQQLHAVFVKHVISPKFAYVCYPLHEASSFSFNVCIHFVKQAGSSGEASLPAVSAVAVIGADGSPQTVELAATLSLFEVPLLSYLSSSSVLDDQARFSYFTRTVPSDNMRVSVRVARDGVSLRECVCVCVCARARALWSLINWIHTCTQ